MSQRLKNLDGARGVLAIIIVLYHVGLNTASARFVGLSNYQANWPFVVDFFFVMSGYVLSVAYVKRGFGPIQILTRRILRLYPLFLLSLFAAAIFRADLRTLLANLTALPQVLGFHFVNSPAWSISYELFVPSLFVAIHLSLEADSHA